MWWESVLEDNGGSTSSTREFGEEPFRDLWWVDEENIAPAAAVEVEADVASKSDGLASKSDVDKHSSDPQADAPADSKMVEDVDNQSILDEKELKEINNSIQLCIEDMVQKTKLLTKKYVQQSINLDDVASPSVVAYDVADPNFKDLNWDLRNGNSIVQAITAGVLSAISDSCLEALWYTETSVKEAAS
ncbi:hypothetical protein LWI28_017617 [Acer negundo]|uniref:Uncharacterized protein n=1 Tax=Acer negundo TaxID=4023 RepID=A0AAD5NJ45_ACENE|nr:hypothetical protein LWI28_017617 [Acer negundo]